MSDGPVEIRLQDHAWYVHSDDVVAVVTGAQVEEMLSKYYPSLPRNERLNRAFADGWLSMVEDD